MAYYIPSTLISEHNSARVSCTEYDKLCKNYDGPDMSIIDPASLDGVYQDQNEPYFTNDLFNAVEALPDGRLKKLQRLFFAEANGDPGYMITVLDDVSEDVLIRLYAACQLMGINDYSTESDKKAGKEWTIQDTTIATVCDKFLTLYESAPQAVKNDDFISVEKLICYCSRQRHNWYPLGDKNILQNISDFVAQFEHDNTSDLVKLRGDKEYHILASWYRWHSDYNKCLEICSKIIDRGTYQYSYNPYRMFARSDRAIVYIEQNKFTEAAQELKKALNDYDLMKNSVGFKALNVASFYENRLFLVSILKVYDILEALTDRNFDSDRANLVKSRSGVDLAAKISNLDIHEYRHQWEEFCKNLRKRMKYAGYIDYVKLFL